jgi:class 3 adenylate cyclase
MKHFTLKIITWGLQLLFICSIAVIVIHISLFAVPYIENAHSYQIVQKATIIEKTIASYIQNIVPTKFSEKEITRWIVIVSALGLSILLKQSKEYVQDKIIKIQFQRKYEALKQKTHLPEGSSSLTPLKEKIEKMQVGSKANREELLSLFAETKKQLDTMQENVAFLAIDLVDAHLLKEGEEKLNVEHDFSQYKNMVDKKFTDNGVLKSAWTPDGVMSCFPTADSAVKTVRGLLMDLERFNKQVKLMKKDFKIRCGINAGSVYYDETLPMEEMSDNVIDVAGHMQKKSPENNVSMPKILLDQLTDTYNFVPIEKVVDGYEVCIFERRAFPRISRNDKLLSESNA